MRYSIKKGVLYILIIMFMLLHSACNAYQISGDPEVVLKDAFSHFNEHEQIGLFGTSEAVATGYTFVETDTLYTVSNHQWVKVNSLEGQNEQVTSNMLLNIEQLQEVSKKVTFDAKSDANKTVIHLDIGKSDLKTVIQQNLLRRLEQIEQKVITAAPYGKQHQLDTKKTVEQAKEQLQEMLNTLEVEAVYQLGVDPHTHVPLTLQVTTILNYEVQGTNKQDTLRGTYEFKVFDKEVVIPQNL